MVRDEWINWTIKRVFKNRIKTFYWSLDKGYTQSLDEKYRSPRDSIGQNTKVFDSGTPRQTWKVTLGRLKEGKGWVRETKRSKNKQMGFLLDSNDSYRREHHVSLLTKINSSLYTFLVLIEFPNVFLRFKHDECRTQILSQTTLIYNQSHRTLEFLTTVPEVGLWSVSGGNNLSKYRGTFEISHFQRSRLDSYRKKKKKGTKPLSPAGNWSSGRNYPDVPDLR